MAYQHRQPSEQKDGHFSSGNVLISVKGVSRHASMILRRSRQCTVVLAPTPRKEPIMAEERIPVLFVGAGAAGLTLSLLLLQQDIPSLLVERRPAIAWYLPRATTISARWKCSADWE